ncbi:MAG: hypothetical protein ACM3PZ_02975 [Bacillota bacterium]
MSKLPQNIIIMKVGPHSNMSLNEIVKSKQDEELLHGVHYWGYSGVFCQPKPTKIFCENCIQNVKIAPILVLLETKSTYESSIGFINKYSANGSDYYEFKKPVQLQGAEFSFVAKNLRVVEDFPLNAYDVVSGKNEGKPLLEHLRFRINKSFATLRADKSVPETPAQTVTVLMADLVDPFAIWLKS